MKKIKPKPTKSGRRRGPGTGHPPFVPSKEQRLSVEVMVGLGMTYEEIALCTINPRTEKGISTRTLQDHFVDELARGQARVKSRVIASLYNRAVSHDHPQGAACAIFIAKCRYGWKEKQAIEITAKSGVLVAPAQLTPEQWLEQMATIDADKEAPGEG